MLRLCVTIYSNLTWKHVSIATHISIDRGRIQEHRFPRCFYDLIIFKHLCYGYVPHIYHLA